MASTYKITRYTYQQAKKIGVTVKPSKLPKYKLDVYKDGKLVTRCGATGYADYPTFRKTKGKVFADARRKLYKQRHEKDRHVVGTRGWYADKLLW